MPAVIAWLLLGAALSLPAAALPAAARPWPRWLALAVVVAYAAWYGAAELSGRPGPAPPGRRWQVPQEFMIGASPRRRALVWGAILGPGFLTRNPYAGFAVLPAAIPAMPGPVAGLWLAAAIGLAHGSARAGALLRDVRGLRACGREGPPGAPGLAGDPAAHLGLLLRVVRWRRLDGLVLLAMAGAALAWWAAQ